MVDINRAIISSNEEEFAAYLEALARISDSEQLPSIIKAFSEKRPKHPIPNGAEHGIFEKGFLRALIYFLAWEKLGEGFGLKGSIIEKITDKFIEENLIIRWSDTVWQVHKVVNNLWQSGNLPFYVLGLSHVAKIMNKSVVAINVQSKSGDINCGSGVLIKANISGLMIVLTNRHVVEGNTIIEVRSEDQNFQIISEPILCDSADLAQFVVRGESETPNVIWASDVQTLDEIVAIGYPRVPTAVHQSAMAHRGEVNGIVKTFNGHEYVAISCHVSPGNSGGPIFNRLGYCAGLVTQSGTTKYKAEFIGGDVYDVTYHMAIPVDILREFVRSVI